MKTPNGLKTNPTMEEKRELVWTSQQRPITLYKRKPGRARGCRQKSSVPNGRASGPRNLSKAAMGVLYWKRRCIVVRSASLGLWPKSPTNQRIQTERSVLSASKQTSSLSTSHVTMRAKRPRSSRSNSESNTTDSKPANHDLMRMANKSNAQEMSARFKKTTETKLRSPYFSREISGFRNQRPTARALPHPWRRKHDRICVHPHHQNSYFEPKSYAK